MRAHAERLGADVRFNTELVSFVQDGEVRALIRNRKTGEEQEVQAAHLIGADGANGTTREAVKQHWRSPIAGHITCNAIVSAPTAIWLTSRIAGPLPMV